jgi:ferric-dicitrate binding protein FerR (iron transport regulator)
MDAELIVSYLSGNISESGRALVENWRQEDENEKLFSAYREAWELSAKDRESILPDTDQAWKNIQEKTGKPKQTYQLRTYHWLAAAATVVLPVLIYMSLFKQNVVNHETAQDVNVPAVSPLLSEVYTTDSLAQFYLPDSSRVLLNKNSKLTFPERFNGERRMAKLTGEGFFEIKADHQHPFYIEVGSSVIKVLGTSFNLKAHNENDIELTVVTGTVEFAAGTIPGKPKIVITENRKASLKDREISTGRHDKKQKEWWNERKKNRFKRFLGNIKKIFKKEN